MNTRKQLEYIPDPNKFDLIVDRWDSQGQRAGPRNPYRKFIMSGAEYYERPVNSGNLWFENNQPAGRVICEFNDKGHISKKEFDFTAPHIAYKPAPSGAEKIAMELEIARAKNAALEAELRAITTDRESKQPEIKKVPVNHAPQSTVAKSVPKLTEG